jgi:hypothetical protein
VEDDVAKFPDAITERGRSHVEHLGEMALEGIRTMVLFVVQKFVFVFSIRFPAVKVRQSLKKEQCGVRRQNIDVFLMQNKFYFKDILMNDNIANLEVFGEVDLNSKEMDLGLEISMTDLLFRSEKKRLRETEDNVSTFDKDKKFLLRMSGPLSEHKLKLMSKRKFKHYQEGLNGNIERAEAAFKKKHIEIY